VVASAIKAEQDTRIVTKRAKLWASVQAPKRPESKAGRRVSAAAATAKPIMAVRPARVSKAAVVVCKEEIRRFCDVKKGCLVH